jgi:hypothetical protein
MQQRGNASAGEGGVVVVDGARKRRQHRDSGERNDIGIEREPRQLRNQPHRQQSRKSNRPQRYVEQPMDEDCIGMPFQIGTEAGQQQIVGRGVIKILTGEVKADGSSIRISSNAGHVPPESWRYAI